MPSRFYKLQFSLKIIYIEYEFIIIVFSFTVPFSDKIMSSHENTFRTKFKN
jgi:hypothetical protein